MTKSWRKNGKQLWVSYHPNIRYYLIGNAFIQVGMGIFIVMYNLYIRQLGMPETVNGKVISMTALASALMLVPAGFLSDRFGRKRFILFGAMMSVMTLFIRGIAVEESSIVIASFFTGIFMAFVQVAGIPFLAENSKVSERVQLFSLNFAIITIANVVGSFFGGLLADFIEIVFQVDAVVAIRIVLMIGSGLFLIGLIPLFRLTERSLRQFEEPVTVQKENHTGSEEIKKFPIVKVEEGFRFNIRLILHFSFASLLIGFGSGLVVPYLNLYFANRFDASNSYIGIILSLGSAMTAVAAMIGPALARKIGKVKALILFQMLSIPFLLLTAYTTSLWLASIGFLLRQALMNAGNPLQSAIAMEVVADKYKGLANSMNQMVFQLGWASMASISTGLVVTYGSYWGYAFAFSITACLYVISSIYYYLVFGRRNLAVD